MPIHGWSGVYQSNSGVRGYSDIRGGIGVSIHGWPRDCQSNFGFQVEARHDMALS